MHIVLAWYLSRQAIRDSMTLLLWCEQVAGGQFLCHHCLAMVRMAGLWHPPYMPQGNKGSFLVMLF